MGVRKLATFVNGFFGSICDSFGLFRKFLVDSARKERSNCKNAVAVPLTVYELEAPKVSKIALSSGRTVIRTRSVSTSRKQVGKRL